MNNREQIDSQIHRFFDENFYLSHYPDVAQAKINALYHYIKIGWREKRKPNPWYSDSLVHTSLIKTNPSTPPFVLFLSSITDAELDGYKTNKVRPSLDVGHDQCWDCAQMREHFDGRYYRRKYGDLAAVTDALSHYCEKGWKEHRDPAPAFSTAYYLRSNPDVAEASLNPFVHYLNKGNTEARKPQPNDIVKKKLGQSLKTVRLVSLKYAEIVPEVKIASKGALFVKLFQGMKQSASRLMLSISHDNYLVHTGGIQKFIHSESEWAEEAHALYFHLCPTQPDVDLVRHGLSSAFLVNCTVRNEFVGTFSIAEVSEVLNDLVAKNAGNFGDAVIHSVMGWDLQLVTELIGKNFKRTIFYAHDYFALCPEYRLLRNGLAPCNPVGSKASPSCTICVHNTHRRAHLAQFNTFIKGLRAHIVFPSDCASGVFAASGLYPKVKSTIVPHLHLERVRGKAKRPVAGIEIAAGKEKSSPKALRVAFCGSPVGHKGFFHFEKIFDMCRGVDVLDFMHLGAPPSDVTGLKYQEVKLHRGKSLMAAAIKEAQVDLVFVGSIWRETFNFVAYEALQAGAAIIALEASGNVVDLIKAHGVGTVVADWQAACKLLTSHNLPAQVMQWKEAATSLKVSENKSIFSPGYPL